MKYHIKNLCKKETGFTLVELLAVIVILGIILAIAVPTVGNVIGDSKEKAHEANVELIENAARLAYASGLAEAQDGEVTIKQLVNGGFLEKVPEGVGDHHYDESKKIVINVLEAENSGSSSGSTKPANENDDDHDDDHHQNRWD